MSVILFRGKRVETGDWVKGCYVRLYDERSRETHRIYPGYAETDCGNYYPDWYEIDPTTVGQFAGVIDENGKQIFEGDIVEPVLTGGTHSGFSWGRQVVVFDRGAFCLKSRRGEITPMCNYAANVQFKVWGNIHDNPELLEVTE